MSQNNQGTPLEYRFSRENFNFLQEFIDKRSGIQVSDYKDAMIYGRLIKRLRALSLPDFDSYCDLIKKGDENEIIHMMDAITTNITRFFREEHHFVFLKNALNELSMLQPGMPFQIWSAGCSSGEEPYSLAITALETMGEHASLLKIFASDLSTKMLATAVAGEYQSESVENIPKEYLENWFLKGKANKEGLVKVSPRLGQMVSFQNHNLMSDWHYPNRFQFIFCRNVIIYFSKNARQLLIQKFAEALKPRGYLVLGHSENLYGHNDLFELVGKSIYRRKF